MNYSTPCYVFDIVKLKERVKYLRSRLPKQTQLCYAIKANPFLVKELEELVDRLELCSEGEYRICRSAQVDEKKYVISGVYKDPFFLEELVRDVPQIGYYTVESERQYFQLLELAGKYKRQILILLRLTSGNQFGLDRKAIEEIVKNREIYPNVKIQGIQFFSGTQKTSLRRMEKELQKVEEMFRVLEEQYGYRPQEFEFGPGFPVSYFEGDTFEEDRYLAEFSKLLTRPSFQGQVTLELGRSIAAGCGTYYTKVVDQKVNKEEGYAIVDGGMHQMVYYGHTMAMKQPKWKLLKEKNDGVENEKRNWNICGSLCTTNDILMKQIPIEGLAVGDVLEFQNTGAYCMTEGISLFLSRDLPKIYMKKEDGHLQCVRERIETAVLNQPVATEKEIE